TLWCESNNASKVGTANGPVPIITRRSDGCSEAKTPALHEVRKRGQQPPPTVLAATITIRDIRYARQPVWQEHDRNITIPLFNLRPPGGDGLIIRDFATFAAG